MIQYQQISETIQFEEIVEKIMVFSAKFQPLSECSVENLLPSLQIYKECDTLKTHNILAKLLSD